MDYCFSADKCYDCAATIIIPLVNGKPVHFITLLNNFVSVFYVIH